MIYQLYYGDCLNIMPHIAEHTIDMILADLPYGTTACKWDVIIPFDKLWEQYNKIIKPNRAIVLFSSQPFTSVLVMSNLKMFKYEWIWEKDKGGNIAILKFQPSKIHENILIFSTGTHLYNPQMEERPVENKRNNKPRLNKVGIQGSRKFLIEHSRGMDDVKYPTSIKYFNSERHSIHPTQKPIDLLEYLIKTYTNENDTVLDNTMGSGSTGIACINTNRDFIGIEKDEHYFQIAKKRIDNHQSQLRINI